MGLDSVWASINFSLLLFHWRFGFALGLSWRSAASGLLGSSLSRLQLKVYSWAAQACPNFRANSRKGSSSCSSQPARQTPLAGLRQACYYKFTPTGNSGKRESLHEVHISSTLAHVASNSVVPSNCLNLSRQIWAHLPCSPSEKVMKVGKHLVFTNIMVQVNFIMSSERIEDFYS